jgi:hypothetical protein
MNISALQRQFNQIGASLAVNVVPADDRVLGGRFARTRPDFVLNVRQMDEGEYFTLTVGEPAVDQLTFLAVDVQPRDRHLLLLSKPLVSGRNKEKFLCGHDERHWFVAPVPSAQRVTNVLQAKEALKPFGVAQIQRRNGVRQKDWHKRHNAGFIRQGEWFFLPEPTFQVGDTRLILRHEPLQRPGGTPHIVEELFRIGGTTVYVAPKHPNGLTEMQYRRLLDRNPDAAAWPWRIMRRNPTVYARGKVRHPDHATIELPFWHRVLMSGEVRSSNVGFLD